MIEKQSNCDICVIQPFHWRILWTLTTILRIKNEVGLKLRRISLTKNKIEQQQQQKNESN